MKYLYIKNGDAAQQVDRVAQGSGCDGAGPDAFLASLVHETRCDELVVVSRFGRRRRATAGGVVGITLADGTGALSKLVWRIGALGSLWRLWSRFRPDRVICGVTGSMFWMSLLLSALYRAPILHSRHNSMCVPGLRGLRKLRMSVDRLALRSVPLVACHGPYLVDESVSLGVARERLFEFDVEVKQMLCKSEARHGKEVIVGYLGRIEIQKGVFDLVEAFERLAAAGLGVRLNIAGEGQAIDELRRRIQILKLADAVHLLGALPRADVDRFFDHIDVLVTPSKSSFPEGRCMSAMESLAAGRPVIAPRFGPFPYLVRHRVNGLLYEPNCVSSLFEALRSTVCERNLLESLTEGARASGHCSGAGQSSFGEAVAQAFESLAGAPHGKAWIG